MDKKTIIQTFKFHIIASSLIILTIFSTNISTYIENLPTNSQELTTSFQQITEQAKNKFNLTKIDDWEFTNTANNYQSESITTTIIYLIIYTSIFFITFFSSITLVQIYINKSRHLLLKTKNTPDLQTKTLKNIAWIIIGLLTYFLLNLPKLDNSAQMGIQIAQFLITKIIFVLVPITFLVIFIYIIILLIKKIQKKLKLNSFPRLITLTTALIFFTSFSLIKPFPDQNINNSLFGVNISSNFNIGSNSGSTNPISINSPSMGMTRSYGMFDKSMQSESIGFSTGGSKDVNNFRENINNNYFPLYTDITYEGLFYDYYFDTGEKQPCHQLFCPSYSYAYSKDPFSQRGEHYLSVGLNSGISEKDFTRKHLNLVIVMDISGSMSSQFNRYYYDGKKQDNSNKSKMQIANESIVALLDHLQPGDQFGMVLFDNSAYLAKPINPVEKTNIHVIQNHILKIKPQGGTNMEAGIKAGSQLLNKYKNYNPSQYENRIIFITDAQPNTGITSKNGLVELSKTNATNNIYTTFIGVGVDFNTELIESLGKIKGSNYYSVHSAKDFAYRMDEGFDYMVTPLVFDLNLKFNSPDYEIEKVYGSPQADQATGEIMKVNTLFPSDSQGGETKGGIVLLKLKKIGPGNHVSLTSSYTDREGIYHQSSANVFIRNTNQEYYENSGIKKGIILSRYVNLLKNWIKDERYMAKSDIQPKLSITTETGIAIPQETDLGQWERQSTLLTVSPEYQQIFKYFKQYFTTEIRSLDGEFNQDIEILNTLINTNN